MPRQDPQALDLQLPSTPASVGRLRWESREYYPEAHATILKEIGTVLCDPAMTNGRRAAEVETRFAELTGAAYCVAVSSCTMGLTLGLRALAPTGRLLAAAFGFPATILAGLWNGLQVRLLSVDHNTFSLDSHAVERECASGDVGAIIAIAVAGNPSGLRTLRKIARNHGVPLLIDAAACHGATVAGESLADLGDLVVLSLSEKKVMPIGEGGIVLTNRADLSNRLKMLRTYGAKSDFDCIYQGLNGRLSEIHAAIAIRCLEYVPGAVARRRQFAMSLNSALSEYSSLRPQCVEDGVSPAFSDLVYRVPANRRDGIIAELRMAGVNAVPFYDPPLFVRPAFRTPQVTISAEDQAEVGALAATMVGFKTHSAYDSDHRKVILDSFQRALTG